MKTIMDFISYWVFYPRLMKSLKRTNSSFYEFYKKYGRFRYAKSASKLYNRKRKIDMSVVDKVVSDWENYYKKKSDRKVIK